MSEASRWKWLHMSVTPSLIASHRINFAHRSTKDPFVLPRKHERQQADGAKVAMSKGSQSDFLTFLNAMQSYDQSRRRGAGGSFR
jgi:hypothetical protein